MCKGAWGNLSQRNSMILSVLSWLFFLKSDLICIMLYVKEVG